METLKSIEKRRSIRNYTKEKISKKTVEDILNCGRLAPSARNRQPWYFVVAENDIKDKIADMLIDYTINNADKIKEKDCVASVNLTVNAIKQAPILILVFKEKDNNWNIGDNLSIGACVENMCLRATELKLGSLWVRDTVYAASNIAKMLGYENMELSCALVLGYANEYPNPRPRKKLENIVKWYDE